MSDKPANFKYQDSFKNPAHFIKYQIGKRMTHLYPQSLFIGITGSVGKSTTLWLTDMILSKKYETISTSMEGDPLVNVAQTLMKLRPNIKKAILEISIQKITDVESYLSSFKPFNLVITNISYDAVGNFGSLEQINQQYLTFVGNLPKEGYAILNYDDLNTRKLADNLDCQIAFYGTDPKNCHIYATNIKINKNSTQFEINYGVERAEVSLPLVGRHYVYAALAACCVGIISGMTLFNIQKIFDNLKLMNMGVLLDGIAGWMVIDESSNISYLSTLNNLDLLNELPARRRILILSEIKGLGGLSEKLHRQIAQKIYKNKCADIVMLTGGESNYLADELLSLGFLSEQVEVVSSNNQLVNKILTVASNGDLILIKGHKSFRFNEVVARITNQKSQL